MQKTGKRLLPSRSKGYLHATGPQFRFILFLLVLLISYTILLRVFQKLAEIVQLPVFLPISLTVLLVFIGIGGILYSHTFVGPINRIRKALDHLAEGDTNIALRLRDSDDPMLKDLVSAIMHVCDRSRSAHGLIRDTSRELFQEISALQDSIHRGAGREELQKHVEELLRKRELLDKAIKSICKV
jgi:methyl-accepting chemotaxis protein